jgi:hypothetical protein
MENLPIPDRGQEPKMKAMGRPALAAAAGMVMAMAAFLGTAQPGFAAPGAASFKITPCAINSESDDACDSTDRMLIVDSVNHGDTDACTFTWKMYWGDGKTEIVTDDGGDQPLIFKALHFYKEPRETTIYQVYWDAISVTGGCSIGSGYGDFVLVVPPR